jgi:pyrimidine deaminase RibD-like protein
MANLPELIAQFQSAARFYYDLAFHNQDEAGTYAALRRLLEVGKALAVELEMAEKDSTELYRLLDAAFMGLEEDRYLSAWEPVRVSLARIATVVALTPPATETKQGEGKGGAGPVLIPAGAPDTRAADPDFQRRFMELAIKEARKSKAEDARVHPKVGVVVVKNGIPMATAYRGEMKEWEHAEYTALEGKLRDEVVAGATVYTTLEPCTSRHHPKIPCLERLIERKVKRVVIGMLDPDSRVSGKGQMRLRKANVAVCLFDHDLQPEIEELNRDFIRDREHANKQQSANKGEE